MGGLCHAASASAAALCCGGEVTAQRQAPPPPPTPLKGGRPQTSLARPLPERVAVEGSRSRLTQPLPPPPWRWRRWPPRPWCRRTLAPLAAAPVQAPGADGKAPSPRRRPGHGAWPGSDDLGAGRQVCRGLFGMKAIHCRTRLPGHLGGSAQGTYYRGVLSLRKQWPFRMHASPGHCGLMMPSRHPWAPTWCAAVATA